MTDCEVVKKSSVEKYHYTQLLREAFDGKEESFLEIVKEENWDWFIDYYENPQKRLVSKETMRGWNLAEMYNSEFVAPTDWKVVYWDKRMIEKLVLEQKIEINYGEYPILESIYEKSLDVRCLDLAEKIGYIRDFPKETPLTKAIQEKYGRFPVKKYYHYVSKYKSERIRGYKNELAKANKKEIGILFGFPSFTKKDEFINFDGWIFEGKKYNVGEVLSIDIGTTYANLKSNDSEKERDEKIKNAKLKTMGWHFVGTDNQGYTDDKKEMQEIISSAKLIITFNGLRFDRKVLENSGINIDKDHYDVYDCIVRHKRVRKSLNHYTKINNLIEKSESKNKGIDSMVDSRRLSSLFYLLTEMGMKINPNEAVKTSLTEGINKIPVKVEYGVRENACYNFLVKNGIWYSHE